MYFQHDKAFTNDLYSNLGSNYRYLKPGIVESVKDNEGLGRIKVRVLGAKSVGGDGDRAETPTEKLPDAFPLIPKHLSVIPKVNDVVWIFVLSPDRQLDDRLYIGPIVSQLDKLDGDNFFNGASPLSPFSFGGKKPGKSLLSDETTEIKIPELIGIFPKAGEISIQGRYNTDITQKHNEVVIRAGKFEEATTNEYKIKFNYKTQGFIQIINNTRVVTTEDEKNTKTESQVDNFFGNFFGSMTNIVSNKINLISHNGSPKFNLNQETLLSEFEMLRILDEAHQLPFGDILLEYLILLKNAIFNHVHNGNGNPATDLATSGNIQSIGTLRAKAQDLENRMLSKNIRIN